MFACEMAMATEEGNGSVLRAKIAQGIQKCPFLRKIVEPTSFTFSPSSYGYGGGYGGDQGIQQQQQQHHQCDSSSSNLPPRRGPIFEDGPAFAMAFELFHGKEGVVPLARKSLFFSSSSSSSSTSVNEDMASMGNGKEVGGMGMVGGGVGEGRHFHPLARAGMASMSMASFGGSGRFSWEGFMGSKLRHVAGSGEETRGSSNDDPGSDTRGKFAASGTSASSAAAAAAASSAAAIASTASSSSSQLHESYGNEWLQSRCPIAKMHNSFLKMLPLVADLLKPPANLKICCPAPIIAARAALARTSAVRSLRPKPLTSKIVAVGALCLVVNIPLGVWREHVPKFSPQWFLAVHASIPFIAMFRKAVLMPKYAIAFTIATAILGQTIGSRAERIRIATVGLHPGTLGECVSNYGGNTVHDGYGGIDDENDGNGIDKVKNDGETRNSLDRKTGTGSVPIPARPSIPARPAVATNGPVPVLFVSGSQPFDQQRGPMVGDSFLPLAGHVRRTIAAC